MNGAALSLSAPILLLFLFWLAEMDVRSRSVPASVLLSGLAAGYSWFFIAGNRNGTTLLFALLPGIFLLAVAAVSRQQIGYGDGMTFLVVGSFSGFWDTVFMLLAALLFAGLFSGIVLIAKKGKQKEELPFLPFVLAAYVLRLALM